MLQGLCIWNIFGLCLGEDGCFCGVQCFRFLILLNKLDCRYDSFLGVLIPSHVRVVSLVCCGLLPPVCEDRRFAVVGKGSYITGCRSRISGQRFKFNLL